MEHSSPQSAALKAEQLKSWDENQIRQLMQGIFSAIRLRDVDGILAAYDEDAIIYDVRDSLQSNKEGLRRSWLECFESSRDFTSEILDLKIEIDGQLAFSFGMGHSMGATNESEKIDIWLRTTNTFRKVDEKWLIVHEHISVPVDFSTGKILQNLKPLSLN